MESLEQVLLVALDIAGKVPLLLHRHQFSVGLLPAHAFREVSFVLVGVPEISRCLSCLMHHDLRWLHLLHRAFVSLKLFVQHPDSDQFYYELF